MSEFEEKCPKIICFDAQKAVEESYAEANSQTSREVLERFRWKCEAIAESTIEGATLAEAERYLYDFVLNFDIRMNREHPPNRDCVCGAEECGWFPGKKSK